jgi:hypothetical protein
MSWTSSLARASFRDGKPRFSPLCQPILLGVGYRACHALAKCSHRAVLLRRGPTAQVWYVENVHE